MLPSFAVVVMSFLVDREYPYSSPTALFVQVRLKHAALMVAIFNMLYNTKEMFFLGLHGLSGHLISIPYVEPITATLPHILASYAALIGCMITGHKCSLAYDRIKSTWEARRLAHTVMTDGSPAILELLTGRFHRL